MYGSYFGSLSIVIRIDIAPFVRNSELRIPNSELILRRLLVCSGRRGRRPLRDWWHTLRLVVGGGVPDAP